MSSKTSNRPRVSQGTNSSNSSSTAKVEKKSDAPNAWSNPIPNAWSRPLKPRPPPGLATPESTDPSENPILRERFLHLLLSLVGQRITVTHSDGTVMEGVFHTATPFASLPSDKKNRLILKAVKVVESKNAQVQNGSTVVVPFESIVYLHCKSLRLGTSNGKVDALRTDTEISSQQNDKSRDLVAAGSAWTNGGNATTTKMTRADALLSDTTRKTNSDLKGNIGAWDQFRANEELFNVKADFDENLYTTELDKSTIDRDKIREAERLAREIEKTTSSNIHVAEERNQVIQGDYDEEDRFSGVLTETLHTRNKEAIVGAPKKVMNYAAAVAKVDTSKATAPIEKKEEEKSTASNSTSITTIKEPEKISAEDIKPVDALTNKVVEPEEKKVEESAVNEDSEKEAEKKVEAPIQAATPDKVESEVPTSHEETEEKENTDSIDDNEKKVSTKLNANAKSFTFNPSAKTFTPSFAVPSPMATPLQAPQQLIDPNTGTAISHIPGQPYYMHSMGHPAMMHMMNHQFSMRYHTGYVGMEQPFPPGQMHPQHMPPQPPLQEGQQASPVRDEEQQPQQQAAEPAPLGIQQQPDPQGQMGHHAGIPQPYPTNVAPFPYNNQIPMQRGPGGPQMGGYHPQIIGGPQQMPVAPGNPYRQIYGVPQHPPSMRGPNSGNYYPNMPPQYSHYMSAEGEDYRGGGRGGGRVAGRGRRGGRSKGGRMGSGRGYPNWTSGQGVGQPNGGGRYTPQNVPTEDPTPAEMLAISEQKPPAE